MNYEVILKGGDVRTFEADEVDVGPAGELRFVYGAEVEGAFQDASTILAPGVWKECRVAISGEKE